MRQLGERARQIPHTAARFALAPQAVRAVGQQRLGRDRGVLNTRARVILDDVEVWFVRHVDLEGLDFVFLGYGHHDAVRLLDRLWYAALGLVDIDGQRLHARDVDLAVFLLPLEVGADLLPSQVIPDARRSDLNAILGGRQQEHSIPVDAWLLRPGGFI